MPRVNSVNTLQTPEMDGGGRSAQIDRGITNEKVRTGQMWNSALQQVGNAFAAVTEKQNSIQDEKNDGLAKLAYMERSKALMKELDNDPDSMGRQYEGAPAKFDALQKKINTEFSVTDPRRANRRNLWMQQRSMAKIEAAGAARTSRLKTHFGDIENKAMADTLIKIKEDPSTANVAEHRQIMQDLHKAGAGQYIKGYDSAQRAKQIDDAINSAQWKALIQKDPKQAAALMAKIKRGNHVETDKATDISKPRGPSRVFDMSKTPSPAERRSIWKKGGVVINLDTNASSQSSTTSPGIVIPDNASPAQRAAAQKYADGMAAMINKKFGRKVKPWVRTKSQNKRGRGHTMHTEPYAITDKEAVAYFSSAEGKQAHADLLQATLGAIPGAQFARPHNPGRGDKGAHGSGTNEYDHAGGVLEALQRGAVPKPKRAIDPNADPIAGDTEDDPDIAPEDTVPGMLKPGQSFKSEDGTVEITAEQWNSLSGKSRLEIANTAHKAERARQRQVKDRITGVEMTAKEGKVEAPERMNALREAAKGSPELESRLARAEQLANHVGILNKLPVVQAEARVSAFRATMGEHATEDQMKHLKSLEATVTNMKTGLQRDPLKFAAEAGVIPGLPLDPNKPESMANRLKHAHMVADKYRKDVTMLSKAEVTHFGEALKTGKAKISDVASQFLQHWGKENGLKALGQLSDSAPAMAALGSLVIAQGPNTPIVKDAEAGMAILGEDKARRHTKMTGENEIIQGVIADAVPNNPKLADTIRNAAGLAYEARARREGWETDAINKDGYTQIVQELLGRQMHNGKEYGGTAKVGTGYFDGAEYTVVAPPGVRADHFDWMRDRIKIEDMPRPPIYNGRPMTQDQMDDARLVSVGNGQYMLKLKDPHSGAMTFATKPSDPGKAYVYDFKWTRPRLQAERSDLFLGAIVPVDEFKDVD